MNQIFLELPTRLQKLTILSLLSVQLYQSNNGKTKMSSVVALTKLNKILFIRVTGILW